MESTDETQGMDLCMACGLCCTGRLFIWVKLKAAELDAAEQLGMQVFRSDPTQRGFSQPCPLWHEKCSIYDSSHYPRACRAYRCKLLKKLEREEISFPEALQKVSDTKEAIREVENRLPPSPNPNFRERLVALLEQSDTDSRLAKQDPQLFQKGRELLDWLADEFGVTDFLE
jgi:hypothetical protein